MMLRILILTVACSCICAISIRADDISLTNNEWTYRFDPAHGNVISGERVGGVFLEKSSDSYTLLLPTEPGTEAPPDLMKGGKNIESTETSDRVIHQRVQEHHVELTCENKDLGLKILKTYWIEPSTGWLFKRIDIAAEPGQAGFLIVESGFAVPSDYWRGGTIWRPTWHEQASAYHLTRNIKEETNLWVNNCTRSVFTLYQPSLKATLVHFRWGSEEFEFFEAVASDIPLARVWPRRWQTAAATGFVVGDENKKLSVQMVYGVKPGTPLDFYLHYRDREEYQRMFGERFAQAPPWVYDTIMQDHIDSSHMEGRWLEHMQRFLEVKHPFGNVEVVYWAPFPREMYVPTPEQNEPESLEDPAALAQIVKKFHEASPRLKFSPYTHYGAAGWHPASRTAQLAVEKKWVPQARNGQRVPLGADFDPTPSGAVPISRTHSEFRDFLKERLGQLFDHLEFDYLYCDASTAWGRCDIDWRTMTSPVGSIGERLYLDFYDIALERGKGMSLNYPPPYGTSSLTEFYWYPPYRDDWRFLSGRLAIQQALNLPGRQLYMCGFDHLASTIQEDSLRTHLNYVSLLGLGFEGISVRADKFRVYSEAAPYLQAAWEVRKRGLVSASVEPSIFDLEGDVEAYAWKVEDRYGLITALNHLGRPLTQKIRFDTEPLGVRVGSPVFLWRTELADPRSMDFSKVTLDSPVERVAKQELLRIESAAPERISIDVQLNPDNPAGLVVSESPAVIAAVDERACQYWLPSAYGVITTGNIDLANGDVSVIVKNPSKRAEILVFVPESLGDNFAVQRRPWGGQHGAGVAPGYESADFTFETIGEHRFVRVQVGTGDTEIVLRR